MPPLMNIADVGDDILKKSLEGNFRGSKVTLVEDVLPIGAKVFPEEEDRTRGHYKILDGMPGNTHAQEVKTFRGVDRLIDVMLGESFAVMVLAKPLPGNGHDASQLETKLDDIYQKLAFYARTQYQRSKTTGTNSSTSLNEGISDGVSESKNPSTNRSKTSSYSQSSTSAHGSSGRESDGNQSGWTQQEGVGQSESVSVSQGSSRQMSDQWGGS